MLNNFEPKEKKAIIIFVALLALGLVYVGTHEIQWENPEGSFKKTEILILKTASLANVF